MVCSIIIATFNRARVLEKTLRHLAEGSVPSSWDVELIIADNGSTDDTSAVVGGSKLKNVEVRYLYEGRKGKPHALNASLAQARGEIILLTDDDVAPAKDWLERMGRPLLERECDGAVGRIELAQEVRRPWMTPLHLSWLGDFHGKPMHMPGANMGFHRSVLDRVPAFDPELFSSLYGAAEDTLFYFQLSEAGFRLKYIPEALVVHYPDASRLVRSRWLSIARKRGASRAYIRHHWRHEERPLPRLRYCYVALKLRLRLLLEPPPPMDAEGIAPWEMSYVEEMEACRQSLVERQRPRNYSKRGLIKHGQPT
jgi:glycosyltransferase involved in cell wall biosynthesis